ncbi:MAG: hypothetical protein ACRCRT_06335 [Cetobacterium somerae]
MKFTFEQLLEVANFTQSNKFMEFCEEKFQTSSDKIYLGQIEAYGDELCITAEIKTCHCCSGTNENIYMSKEDFEKISSGQQ